MNAKRNMVVAVATALGMGLAVSSGVLAHGYGYGYGGGHMMGGYGYGGGHMMGGYGHGMHGPMTYGEDTPFVGHQQGLGPVWTLDLTPAQRTELTKIQDRLRKQHWALQGKLEDQYAKLRDLNAAEPLDKTAIDATYDEIFKLRRQFVEATTDARIKADKLLTPEQRQALTRWQWGGPSPCVSEQG